MQCVKQLIGFLANQSIYATTRYFAKTQVVEVKFAYRLMKRGMFSCISKDARYDSLSCDSTPSASPLHEMYGNTYMFPSISRPISYELLFCEDKSW